MADGELDMAQQFTPGPWTNEPGLFFICNVGNNLDDPGVWSTAIPADGVPFPFGSKEADARLIAAAPELLDALQTLLDAAPVWSNAVAEKARAAVDKALGEQVSA